MNTQPSRIALTTIDRLEISTVDLGDFHNGQSYETCVFYPDGQSSVVWNHSTRADALECHARIVKHEISYMNHREKVDRLGK